MLVAAHINAIVETSGLLMNLWFVRLGLCVFFLSCLKQFNWILITYDFFILTEANSEATNMDQEQVATVSLLYSICPLLFLAPTSFLVLLN